MICIHFNYCIFTCSSIFLWLYKWIVHTWLIIWFSQRATYCFVDFGGVDIAREVLIKVNGEPIPGGKVSQYFLYILIKTLCLKSVQGSEDCHIIWINSGFPLWRDRGTGWDSPTPKLTCATHVPSQLFLLKNPNFVIFQILPNCPLQPVELIWETL